MLLSGLPASGKSTLSRKLSEHYGWPVYSIGQMWRDEWKRIYPGGEPTFEQFWRDITTEQNLEMNIRARERFREGRIILDTRYPVFYENIGGLFIFLTAGLDVRASRVMGRYGEKTKEDVMQELARREEDEVRTGGFLFGKGYDYRDPLNYHITLNSGLLTPDEKFRIVTDLAG